MSERVKVTTRSKVETIPGHSANGVLLEEIVVENAGISGGKQMGAFIFNSKVNGKKFNKLYIDKKAGQILGKADDISPWQVVTKIEVQEIIHL